jgi:uncharacterized membrane protein YeaQ/YmgE (transglycosylase-associated protein family)
MIGMNFRALLILFVAALIAAGVLHYVIRYRFLEGFDGFVAKCIAGWVGAWLGSPVLGHRFERAKLANVYLIPALLGAFVGAFVVAATGKTLAKAFSTKAS